MAKSVSKFTAWEAAAAAGSTLRHIFVEQGLNLLLDIGRGKTIIGNACSKYKYVSEILARTPDSGCVLQGKAVWPTC